ncbi:GTP diphosphokinase [Agitococcus lubricus]|uniref:GTP pyrophosphokinase n=1 Tax=Agitococcus lubricus TaxID=1077255 RepID=A0A2T5IZQ6_9GAMM|nr:GTP diphosphokinase [Agitococcus lubricus]PTQ89546.1 GTP pyrophosphokinase [Agitococcus lubricus]
MVKVREDYPLQADGQVDLERWLNRIAVRVDLHSPDVLKKACLFAKEADETYDREHSWSMRTSSFLTGLAMADILADLKLDQESLVAAVLYRAVREEKTSLEIISKVFGQDIAHLIDGVLRMATISQVINPNHHNQKFSQSHLQLDNIRKMLVSMIDDVRIALIKLAERTFAIRELKDASDERKKRVAREIFDIYAPLAHRLGIGHIKWELEDLSFRYLEPEAYKHIARLLDEKRLQRDEYIHNVTQTLRETLAASGIYAEVKGRAKHIYSIWRKMQRKKLSFHELYDIRAVRVLVPEIKDCYAALGVVHSLWKHIPKEFDDYVATPKENGYRSLHTAVIGPEGKALEVQIRTLAMHEEAELGVCAHWVYKEGARGNKDTGYESKIAWLRQVLEWQEDMGETQMDELADQLTRAIRYERVYVFTRDGHVIDLQAGATPLDFAYSIHTQIGHSCRGAKVNGRIVPLSYKLQTSDQVEILTQKGASPSRDWLLPSLGYLGTSRAQAKVKQWFKLQDRENNISAGREILEKELSRLSLTYKSISLSDFATRLNVKTADDVLAGIGAGDIRPAQVINLVADTLPTVEVEPAASDFISRSRKGQSSGVVIDGIDNIMTHIAGCCRPIPGEPIVGYITHNRGVSVHARACSDLLRLQEEEPQRVIEVHWQQTVDAVQSVNIAVKAWDRTGLLRDISGVLANEHVNVTGVNTQSNKQDGTAQMQITVEVKTLEQLGRVLAKIEQQPNVISARRLTTVS